MCIIYRNHTRDEGVADSAEWQSKARKTKRDGSLAKGDAAYDYDLWTTEETTVFRKRGDVEVQYTSTSTPCTSLGQAASGSWAVRGMSEAVRGWCAGSGGQLLPDSQYSIRYGDTPKTTWKSHECPRTLY